MLVRRPLGSTLRSRDRRPFIPPAEDGWVFWTQRDKNLDAFKAAVRASVSMVEVIRKMQYKYSGGAHSYFKGKIQQYGLDTSHFTGRGWAAGKTRETDSSIDRHVRLTQTPWEKIFCLGTKKVSGKRLLTRLIRAGKREWKCEECGLTEWRGRPIPLDVHHINENNVDNREENLMVLCKNCHGQKHPYKTSIAKERVLRPKTYKQPRPRYMVPCVCSYCSKQFVGRRGQKYCGYDCSKLSQRKAVRPSAEVLKDLIEHKSFSAIAAQLGVSDAAVRKWVKRYDLPYPKYRKGWRNKSGASSSD